MRIAYLNCASGISGDMFLGALVDAGVPAILLSRTIDAMWLGAKLEFEKVMRCGITATRAKMIVDGKEDSPEAEHNQHVSHVHGSETGGTHAHDDLLPHEHSGDAGKGPTSAKGGQMRGTSAHGPHHGRGLSEIREIILRAPVPEGAQNKALAIFENLGAAEAKIHNIPVEQVHFHEVGAVDAICDIMAAAVGAESLAVDEWVCSPLNVGGGSVMCSHGRYPVPAPATLELLAGAPLYSSGVNMELVTPTGAAIVKTLCTRFAEFPAMKVDRTGYGAGFRDIAGQANVVRLSVGESTSHEASAAGELVTVIEANLDDLNPQVFGYVLERALNEGALDVFATPVQMKKNRPGTLLTMLARPEDARRLADLVFRETTTLGIRMRQERRATLQRESLRVATPWGEVRMKIASLNGDIANYAPEYEDCRRIATHYKVPLKTVMQEAVRAYLGRGDQHG